MPRVSIIVPAYNAARYLAPAIESVLAQTYSDWELVIIDDGSTDNTCSIVESYVPRLGKNLLYIWQSNRGLPAARNRGIRGSCGEFIAILDADDVWLPGRLLRGVEVMDSNPHVGLVHSRNARIDVKGEVLSYPCFPPKYLSGRIAGHLFTRRAVISCPTVMFRRQCLDMVGPFDETMRATEDRDLWFRIAQHYEIAYIDEILAHSRITPGSMSSDANRMLTWQLFFVDKYYRKGACTWTALHEASAQIYREYGDILFGAGQLKRSISFYFRAVLHNPLNLTNVYMLVRAMADPFIGVVAAARMPAAVERNENGEDEPGISCCGNPADR